uniref:Uncharacterized protein n=1 Tax=Rhizophora mucronata TaxID=61149 RepID=A0A2P2M4K5_RHIMU
MHRDIQLRVQTTTNWKRQKRYYL